ncbi:MAG: hypothetical protein JXM79_17580 [Sedimentisphaerales bacterium]|nr:hypothetical protein [Sedimentisphaerales bacterium]
MTKKQPLHIVLAIMIACFVTHGYTRAASVPPGDLRWNLAEDGSIQWTLDIDASLPHQDHMAMSGRSVDMILEWGIDAQRTFRAERLIRWPMLRTLPDNTHASLSRRLSGREDPVPCINDRPLSSGIVQDVLIHGFLQVTSRHKEGITSIRTVFPSVQSPVIIDLCRLTNTGRRPIEIHVPRWRTQSVTEAQQGTFGSYVIEQFLIGEVHRRLVPGETWTYSLIHSARKENDAPYFGEPEAEFVARQHFVADMESRLILETPDPVLNRLFAFSKVRGCESIFSTRGGLMHGPGGYNKYLAAVWANDQAEYINPFFPFLGHAAGNESALNCYRHFAKYMNPEYRPIPSSIIAEGRSFWNGAGDRGDMAMIAYGASRFALASGHPEWSRELWPLIEWCLDYCDRKKTSEGIIASDTDELENRFPAGEANLCTSSLYYDALLSTAYLADDLGKDQKLIDSYRARADALHAAMRSYFEADVEGFATYRYYEGNTVLRSWICIPLTVGIKDRLEGTAAALFSPRLWTQNGLLTKAGTKTVWDRSTLYALRGVIYCGAVDVGLEKLQSFSRWRLLGDHVPYVIEAYPEQNQSHLSAESGLYCRIFTEGFFGIRPTGWQTCECTPHLPAGWDKMALRKIQAFGLTWDMDVVRDGVNLKVRITDAANNTLYEKSLPMGETHHIKFSTR